jgi:hypothetical protein
MAAQERIELIVKGILPNVTDTRVLYYDLYDYEVLGIGGILEGNTYKVFILLSSFQYIDGNFDADALRHQCEAALQGLVDKAQQEAQDDDMRDVHPLDSTR